MIRKVGQIIKQCQLNESNDNLLGINIDPISSTTNFCNVSCTLHVTIGRIRWDAWAVNYIVTIYNAIFQII